MMGKNVWGWADSDNSPVAGTSVAEPWLYSKFLAEENGSRVISGQMQLGENEELGWSSACIFVGIDGASKDSPQDLGTANQLLLTGFVTKDEVLEIRLVQSDMEDWKGWPARITGTGDSLTTYSISLPTGSRFPD